jgi:hypothetical protein
MTATEMSRSVEKFFLEANKIQWSKNKDYHPDNVAFLEILRTACDCGITVEQDLWAKVRKQMSALRSYVIDGNLESEPPVSRMTDVAVYMGMFAFWEENKQLILRDAFHFLAKQKCERGFSCGPMNTQVGICERCRFYFWLAKQLGVDTY